MTTAPMRAETLEHLVRGMSASLTHRGPDDEGTWIEPTAGLAFGFRRLAIIDLSANGHQPMQSASGRYTLVFNGEIYNYRELRDLLHRKGHAFHGRSDTEVICAAFEHWGVEGAVRRFVGMFAIAAWDASLRRLSLVRDRLGIKPLFFYHRPGILTFGSELKALVTVPGFDKTVDNAAIGAYLRYLYVPAPNTIYRYAQKILPGHILSVDSATGHLPGQTPYWSVEDVCRGGATNTFDGSDSEAVSALTTLLTDAVRLRMEADVPLGVLLSGGVDSSLVAALMQANSSRAISTFSIAFPGTEHDESVHAARVAKRLGTSHTEMPVTGEDALATVPLLPEMFDEPFADPSQIPTYLVCKLARREVTVALTGDGGDEVFGGYERYIWGSRVIRNVGTFPRPIRRMIGIAIGTLSEHTWDGAYRMARGLVPSLPDIRLPGQKLGKLGVLFNQMSEEAMYLSLLAACQHPQDMLAESGLVQTRVEEEFSKASDLPLLDRMMLLDQQTYLPDDLLAKVDRASMAVSLEARVPLLDHRVVEFGWTLKPNQKIRGGKGKWLLRQVLYSFVERDLVDRPKMGFSVPLGAWLRGPLREWAEDLLFGVPNDAEAFFRTDTMRQKWGRLQMSENEDALGFWAALMLIAWARRWLH
jgi:asparagine synthase (glutamine-hydrolysing)